MPLSYRDVLEAHDRAAAFGETRSLPEYAAAMNQATGTNEFSEGLRDGAFTQARTRLDQFADATLGQVTGPLGGVVGGLFGGAETGEKIGMGLAEGAADMAPMMIPGVGPVAGALATGGLMGAHTYAQTGVPAAAAVSAITGFAMPGIAGKTGDLLAQGLGTGARVAGDFVGESGVPQYVSQVMPTGSQAAFQASKFAGGQIGMLGTSAVSDVAMHKALGQPLAPDWKEILQQQIPWTAWDAMHVAIAPKMPTVGSMEANRVQPKPAEPPAPPKEGTEEGQAKAQAILDNVANAAQSDDPAVRSQSAKIAIDMVDGKMPEVPTAVPDSIANLAGKYVTHEDGSKRMLVYDSDRPDLFPKGSTHFLNGPDEPVFSDALGMHQVLTKVEDTAPARNPLEYSDFGDATPGQQELVPRAEGMKPTAVGGVKEEPAPGGEVEPSPIPPVEQRELATLGVTPEAVQKATTQSVSSFTTAKGSTYDVNKDGTTTRNKAARPEHPGESGPQPRSEKTVYVDAGKVDALARPEGSTRYWINDRGEVSVLTKNAEGKWGISPSAKDIPATTEPGVGKIPLEVWDKDEIGVKGGTAYKTTHFGNEIVSVTHAGATTQSVPKMSNPILDMIQGPVKVDEAGNVRQLGNTDVAKTGLVDETRFMKTTSMPKEMLPALKEFYPEAFTGGKVDATKLVKLVKERPMVEVKKLVIQEGVNKDKSQQITHELDTRFPGWVDRPEQRMAVEERELFQRLNEATHSETTPYTPHARFGFVSPTVDMPGYVEGLVRVPMVEFPNKPGDPIDSDRRMGIKYSGPHFGNEDTNVLAFFRGYEEPRLDGGKTFHVIEVQSDWAQRVRKANEINEQNKSTGNQGREIVEGHPLLASYETLALKAAIDHARSIGADRITLPDAETAMMTEGHDKVAKEGKVSQDAGMRLHYATTLPNAAAKLTGDKGQKVDLGVHRAAMAPDREAMTLAQQQELIQREGPNAFNAQGSPVFRNPDGTPKTNVTGRSYSLEKINVGLEAKPDASIKEAVQKFRELALASERVKQKAEEARKAVAVVPKTDVEWTQVVPDVEAAKKVADATKGDATQKAEAARLSQQTKEIDAAEQQQAINREAAKTISMWNDKPQKTYDAGAFLDEAGKRVTYPSRAEALEAKVKYENDPANTDNRTVEIRDAGGGIGTPNHRGFYLAHVTNSETSMDAPRGEGGVDLHNAVTQAVQDEEERVVNGEAPVVNPQDRPKDSFDSFQQQMDMVMKNPREFEQATKVPYTDVQRAKAIFDAFAKDEHSLGGINEELERNGLEPFATYDEMEEAMSAVREGVQKFTRKYRSSTLGSEVPYDPKLVAETGVHRGAAALLDWIIAQKIPTISAWMEGLKQFPEILAAVRLNLPRGVGFIPRELFYLPQPGDPVINVGNYPTQETKLEWAMNLAHEFVHHFDLGLSGRNDPAAQKWNRLKTELLEHLRNSEFLPKEVRDMIRKSVKEGWYDQYVKDGTSIRDRLVEAWSEAKTNKYFGTVYALQNEWEMVAQAFSDHDFLDMMQKTKATKDGFVRTVLNFFSKGFNELVRGKPEHDSALEQLLTGFSNYLTAGKLRNTYNGADYIRDTLLQQGVHPDAVASRMNTVDRTFTKGSLLGSISGYVAEGERGILPATMQENFGQVDQPLRTALVSGNAGAVFDGTMDLLAAQLPVHNDLLFRMRQDVDTARSLYFEIKAGRVPGSIPPGAEAELAHSTAKLDRMEAAMTKQGLAIQRWNNLDALTPDGWGQQVAAGLGLKVASPSNDVPEEGSARRLMAMSRAAGETHVSWLDKTFMLTQHFMQTYPAVKAAISRLFDEQGIGMFRQTMLDMSAMWDGQGIGPDGKRGDFSKTIRNQIMSVAKDATLLKTFSDIARYRNREGKMQPLDLDSDFVKAQLSRLTQKGREAVLATIKGFENRKMVNDHQILPEALSRIDRTNTAIVIAKMENVLPDRARELSGKIFDALAQLTDPQNAPLGAEALKQVAAEMTPDTFVAAYKTAQQFAQKTAANLKIIWANPGHTSEQRYGKNQLVMLTPDGKTTARFSGTQEEMSKMQAARLKEGYTTLDYIKAEDRNRPSFGVNDDMLSAMSSLDSQHEQTLRQVLAGNDDLLQQILPLVQSSGDIRASLAAAAPLPTISRRFAEGRETINMMDNANQFYHRQNSWLKNKNLRAEAALELTHPDLTSNPELTKYVNDKVRSFLTPDNPVARRFTEATFFARLGMNFGANFVESLQHLTGGVSALISESGSVGDSIGRIAETTKNFWYAASHGGKWANPEHADLSNFLESHGMSGLVDWNDFTDKTASDIMQGGNVVTKGASAILYGARNWSTKFSRYNDLIVAHAAYDLARAKGMSIEDAYTFARDTKNIANHSGGKAQRPTGLWNIQTKAVPQLLQSLQTYTLGWFGQLRMNYVRGFTGRVEGLTPEQKTGAKKAFLYSIAAQAVLAGGLGLPGVGQGIALLNQTAGIDAKGWLRQNLAKLFEEDQQFGGVLTSLALRGVGSAGLPFDPSSRMSLNVPFLGVDEVHGFSPANLGGAVTSTLGDVATGMLSAFRGDKQGFAQALPSALKRPYELCAGDGDLRKPNGALQVQLSPAEKFWMAVGVKPTRVQTLQDVDQALTNANTALEHKQGALADDVATTMRRQGTAVGKSALEQALQRDPTLDRQKFMQMVVARYQAQVNPVDARRSVRPGVDIAGLSTGLPPSELARRQSAEEATQGLGGLARPGSGRADLRASQIDALLQANPYMTRQSASEQLPTKGRVVNRTSPALTPAYLSPYQ